jgi:hypothetical protein
VFARNFTGSTESIRSPLNLLIGKTGLTLTRGLSFAGLFLNNPVVHHNYGHAKGLSPQKKLLDRSSCDLDANVILTATLHSVIDFEFGCWCCFRH